MIRMIAFLAALGLVLATSQAQAGFNGTLTLIAGSPTTNGNLATATTFNLGSLSASSSTGDFANVPSGATFTSTSFNYPVPPNPSSSMTVANSSWGTFTQTSQATDSLLETPGVVVRSFDIEGEFSTGSMNGGVDGGAANEVAKLIVTLTQISVPGDTILNGTATMVVGPVSVPQPASVAMVGLGMMGLGGYAVRRQLARRSKALLA
jgi:hypothetical protein